MDQNQPTEYGTGRGVQRMPDGRQRPLTERERLRVERTAALRDQPLAEAELGLRRQR